ncbi:MAG: MFS transporter [Rhodobacteraceae bacterium]|nr:MFS transporter [Paracoccaceae bacterium]
MFSPLLVDVAEEFSVSLSLAANLFVVFLVANGIGAFAGGRIADLRGRRVVMIGCMLVLAFALIGASLSEGLLQLAGWFAISGLCAGACIAAILAEVSVRVGRSQRGRAFAWVMLGYSLTNLVGVPVSARIGAEFGWRGVPVFFAGLSFAMAFAMFATTGPKASSPSSPPQKSNRTLSLTVILRPSVLRLFSGVLAERICYGLIVFYYPTHLRLHHKLELDSIALPMVIYAIGYVSGLLLGGQIADRIRDRRIFIALALSCCGVIGLVWFLGHTTTQITVGVSFCFALSLGSTRPLIAAELADVPEGVRGSVMGLNGTISSIGMLIAVVVGGWVHAQFDFEGFGPVIALVTAVGSGMMLWERRIAARKQQDD